MELGMWISRLSLGVPVLALAVFPVLGQRRIDPGQNLAPYVPSPQPIVERMLEAADLKPGEVVYDLGCGDGRIVVTAAREFHAHAVGVELSEKLVEMATDSIKRLGLANSARIIHGNLLNVDLSDADVVTLYLLTSSNERLKPNLEKSLKPGARVVSHDFQVRGWKPERVDEVYVYNRTHKIYVYKMPPEKK